MDSNSSSKNKIGVVLVGHGSRLPYGKEVINQLAEKYQKEENYLVSVGFMEMTTPTIPNAVNELARQGVEKIIVTPVFLAHGVHTKKDIPHILGLDNGHETGHSHSHKHKHHEDDEEIDFSGEIIYTEPLGADPRVVEIIKDRVNHSL
ncbi:MAG: sirohydrochlorin nickelochelatase [Euryarchaeota archaeon]|nr:sirohydrochlorin nickelochelatase [Euryarchaeota archaeon]MBV1728985.1 sirohydrochlorin nickelochelatase [Methanobacterium sp.]MBU4548101.1 sirohydrochlorin nickelochelatase [Euryarchaeota archaeon]MBU4607996.1 sirohydrochlorin nickelochelatase [Euryarchaeota archaeon]MBV1755202.1 sirohydrochlorin nickelochelatase [Methanobacterium sp.]